MRTTHHCPKCKHNRILLIDQVPDQHVATTSIHDGFFGGERLVPQGQFEAAVCRRCGYTELYTANPGQITIDGKRVREIVGAASGEPYR